MRAPRRWRSSASSARTPTSSCCWAARTCCSAVVGFNFARFQLTDAGPRERVRHLLRSAARIAVPSVLVIARRSRSWKDGLGWRRCCSQRRHQLASWTRVAGTTGSSRRWSTRARGGGAGSPCPPSTGSSGAHPFWLPFGARRRRAAHPLRPRRRARRQRRTAPTCVFWLFALGWARRGDAPGSTVRCCRWWSWSTVPGLLRRRARATRYVAVGLLVARLGRAPSACPSWSARVVGVLAGASLWIYLLHWQVYPHLEHRIPWLATVPLAGRRRRRLVDASRSSGRRGARVGNRETGTAVASEVGPVQPDDSVHRKAPRAAHRDDQPAHVPAGPAGDRGRGRHERLRDRAVASGWPSAASTSTSSPGPRRRPCRR